MNREVSFQLGVKGVIVNGEGKILLLQANTKSQEMRGERVREHWDIPGGRITWENVVRGEDGTPDWPETYASTLTREIAEETGLTNVVSQQALNTVHATFGEFPRADGEKVFLLLRPFVCAVVGDTAIQLSEEHKAVFWATPSEAADLLGAKWPPDFTEQIRNLDTSHFALRGHQ